MAHEETIFQKPGGSVRNLHRQPAWIFSLFFRFCQYNQAGLSKQVLRFGIMLFCPIQAGLGTRRGWL